MQTNNAASGNFLTITQAVIDRWTRVEIQLDKTQMQLHLIVYRAALLKKTPVKETYGPCGSFGELREHLHRLFGEAAAEGACHPSHEKKIA